jgi:hypothetical protein
MVTNFPKARAISITVEPQRAAERSTRRHSQFGKLGAASPCQRIDPKTGYVIEELPAKYNRDFTRKKDRR